MIFTLGLLLFGLPFVLLLIQSQVVEGHDNIPTIPLYISFLSIIKGEGRVQFYEKHLRHRLQQKGIVRTWLAGKWSLIITDPELLVEVLKNERVFAKAGFVKKAPGSVFAKFFGHNIIDSHGDDWKRFVHYMKPGIQDRQKDVEKLASDSKRLVSALLAQQKYTGNKSITYDGIVARWAMAVAGEHFFEADFRTLEDPNAPMVKMMQNMRRIAPTPWISLLPALEYLDWLWPSRRDKGQIVQSFRDYFRSIAASYESSKLTTATNSPQRSSVLDGLMRGQAEGKISSSEVFHNMFQIFFAGHENVLSLLKSLLWVLGNDLELQSGLRAEILNQELRALKDIEMLPGLAAVILEATRLYPPISQLANRQTNAPVTLGDGRYMLPAGQWVGWNSYAVQTDPRFWGGDSLDFNPERWGSSVDQIEKKVQRCEKECTYIAFNAHARKCMGKSFALTQTKIVLVELLRRTEWKLDSTYMLKNLPGSILAPHNVRMVFTDIDPEHDREAAP